jgi:hypothetical protein
MVVMTCCDTRYATVAESMGHTCEGLVKIEIRTETNGERGMIVTEPQSRERAIRVLAETFGLSETGWMYNTQAKITGDTLWQWTLVKA